MRLPLIWTLGAIAALSLPVHAQNKYVGAKTCVPCHGRGQQQDASHVWQTSKHAQAYHVLAANSESEPRKCGELELWVVEIGRGTKYGLPRPAAESKECLPCHVTAFGSGPQQIASSFDPKDGVQCESCHGPGSAHVEDKATNASRKSDSGLKVFGDETAIKAQCRTCHEGTCGDFDFAKMWPAIRHSSPRGH